MIKDRPFPLTLACLGLILSGTYYLLTSFSYLQLPETQAAMQKIAVPYDLQLVMMYLNQIVMIICAIYMFEEANWARWVYLGWGFVNIDYRLYIQTDWHHSVIVVASYLVVALILVVPSSNEYFSSTIHYIDD